MKLEILNKIKAKSYKVYLEESNSHDGVEVNVIDPQGDETTIAVIKEDGEMIVYDGNSVVDKVSHDESSHSFEVDK